MPASAAHELIVALIARRIVQSGYEIARMDSSLDWLFGESFRLPPPIMHHRPDVLGVRARAPFLAVGDAKTTSDLYSPRTSQQLRDYTGLVLGADGSPCWTVIGIPQSGAGRLDRLIARLGIPRERICVLLVPDPILNSLET